MTTQNQSHKNRSNSIELIFRPSITEDEYQSLVEAAKLRACPQCGGQFNVGQGADGPDTGKGIRYCSPGCVRMAVIGSGLLLKPEPQAVIIDNWEV